MCGIIGSITQNSRTKIDLSLKSELPNYIHKRGPDFYGYRSIDTTKYNVSLGHSRLSIIDLSTESNQPFSLDDRYYLSFNGEIYNYIEIRETLIKLGYRFRTQGDTEVLITSWKHWGPQCLDKFNGMFAFILFDKEEEIVYLVRDRYGVKPLTYSIIDQNNIFFSSSVKAHSAILPTTLDLDYLSTSYHYELFEGITNSTIYNEVKYVNSGAYFKIDLSKPELSVQEVVWYDLKSKVDSKIEEVNSMTECDIIDKIYALLKRSIEIRLRSDVPVGISLSGGVDSSTIAALARTYSPNIEGFTYGNPTHLKSEGKTVEDFAKHINLKVNYIWLDDQSDTIVNAFNETFEAQELPFYSLSVIAQNQVYKRVRESGVKVLLGGQGGDEIFAGYRKFFIQGIKNSIHRRDVNQTLSFFFSFIQMVLHESHNYKVFWQVKNRYFGNLNQVNCLKIKNTNPLNLIGNSSTSIRERQIDDITKYSIPTLLRYEDRNSMYHSIESRLPFMDFELVELAIAIPEVLKIRQGMGKWALRKAVHDIVPANILYNKLKRGFDVTQDWMKLGLESYLESNIRSQSSKLRNFDIKITDELMSEIKQKNMSQKTLDLMFLYFLTRN